MCNEHYFYKNFIPFYLLFYPSLSILAPPRCGENSGEKVFLVGIWLGGGRKISGAAWVFSSWSHQMFFPQNREKIERKMPMCTCTWVCHFFASCLFFFFFFWFLWLCLSIVLLVFVFSYFLHFFFIFLFLGWLFLYFLVVFVCVCVPLIFLWLVLFKKKKKFEVPIQNFFNKKMLLFCFI